MTEAARLLIDDVQRSGMLLHRANPSHAQQFGEHADLRQRRSQLVRYARYEVGSQSRQCRLASKLPERDGHESGRDCEQRQENGKAVRAAKYQLPRRVGLE